jgi:hypothetical protein
MSPFRSRNPDFSPWLPPLLNDIRYWPAVNELPVPAHGHAARRHAGGENALYLRAGGL